MDPISAIRRAFRPGGTASDQSYAIVLVEKHHHFLRKETLRAAAEKAYGHSFAPGNPDYSVTQSTSTFVKRGEDTVHITQSSAPLDAAPFDVHLHGHTPIQFKDHRGYVTFEMWNKGYTKFAAYRVLAPLVAEFLGDPDRIVGVLFTRDNEFYPNDGSASEQLQQLANAV